MAARISAASSGSVRDAVRRVPLLAWPPGVARSSSRDRQPGGLPGALGAGGAAGAAQPGSGDRPGEDLDDGVLAVAQPGGGAGQRPQRGVRVMAHRQREDLGAGQPQRPAFGQGAGWQRGASG